MECCRKQGGLISKKNKKEDTFFPPEFYDGTKSPNAPRDVKTSGITQAPIHAICCVLLHLQKYRDEKRVRAKGFFGKISRTQHAALVPDLIITNISRKIDS